MVLALADGGPVRSVVVTSDEPKFQWIDIGAPDRAMLHALTVEYGLPESAVHDFIDPQQLPKYERHGPGTFMILRAHVEPTPAWAASAHELTQSIAIFTAPGVLLTLHHRDHRALAQLRARYASGNVEVDADFPRSTLDDVIRAALRTFNPPCDQLLRELTGFEESLLSRRITEAGLTQVFIRRRRASTLATLLRRTREVIAHVRTYPVVPDVDDTGELADTLEYRAHEMVEYTDQLINLQIAVASYRTNEVVRLLTLISVVFMPLTFIVGLYGMNFDLPEFALERGYLIPYGLIIGSLVVALVWFRKRGWLG